MLLPSSDAGAEAGVLDGGIVCGNQVRQDGEECDGDDLGGEGCTTIGEGWVGGALECTATCSFDTTACQPPPGCGDGIVGGAEQCDGTNLAGASCTTEGFTAGDLACTGGCLYDRSGCYTCGDQSIDGPEVCDGTALGGATCVSLGYSGGTLACSDDCLSHDASGCSGGAPTVPVLRKPMNASYTGSVLSPGSLRPTFTWEPSTLATGGTVSYELEYSTDPTFTVGVTLAATTATSHVPATDLAVSITPPVGARYYWRVRACNAAVCSAYALPWYVGVGRTPKDFNGDGYADVAVGATGNDTGGMDTGRAYVYFGGPGGVDSLADGSLSSEGGDNDQFGRALAAADFNADGFGDLAVGAPQQIGGGAGYVHLFFGGPGSSFDTAPDGALYGAMPFSYFGFAVGAAGDVDGDGFADLLVGAYGEDGVTTDSGRAYLYRGGPGSTLDVTPDGVLDGGPGGVLGVAAFGADVTGDGFSDILITTDGFTMPDSVRVFHGGPGALDTFADSTLTSASSDDDFGVSLSAGDVNGDGFADVVIGARLVDGSGTNSGATYVHHGSVTGVGLVPAGTLIGEAGGDFFGLDVDGAGDANADGYADVVVGALTNAGGGVDAGRAYVFFGGAALLFDATADVTITGMPGSLLGYSVAFAGDVDGDDVDDLVVSATGSGGSPGAAYIYHGLAGGPLDSLADAVLSGAAANDVFGQAVAAPSSEHRDRSNTGVVPVTFAAPSRRHRLRRGFAKSVRPE